MGEYLQYTGSTWTFVCAPPNVIGLLYIGNYADQKCNGSCTCAGADDNVSQRSKYNGVYVYGAYIRNGNFYGVAWRLSAAEISVWLAALRRSADLYIGNLSKLYQFCDYTDVNGNDFRQY